LKIINDVKLDFDDVLIKPKRSTLSSRKDVILERNFKFKWNKNTWVGIPIIAANMSCTGTFNMARALIKHGALTALHKHYNEDELINAFTWDFLPNTFYTIGINTKDYDKLKHIMGALVNVYDSFPYMLCIDVANGYTENFISYVKEIRHEFPESIIMAGNVVTGNMVEELLLSGADIVKIGIGSGAACTTRSQTGIGYPQLSAIANCADAAHGLNGYICSDGGIRTPGDMVKAFAAGADFVMMGNMFAGTDECEGNWWEGLDDRKMFDFYGMASGDAMERYNGNADYRTTEGKTISIEAKGPVDNVMKDLLGGLRSACSYVGARRLKDLPKCATFVRVR